MKKLLMVVAVAALALGTYSLLATAQDAAPAADAPKAEPAPAPAADAPKAEPAPAEAPKVEAPKIDPAFEADIRKLLALLKLEQSIRQNILSGVEQLKTRMPQVPADRWTTAVSKINWGDIVDIQVPIYAKVMKAEDVKAAVAFYESPAGTRLLESQSVIGREAVPAMQAWFQKVAQQIMQDATAGMTPAPAPMQ